MTTKNTAYALIIGAMVIVGSTIIHAKSTQTTEAAKYAARKNECVANINAAAEQVNREEFKLSELQRKVETAKQEIRNARLKYDQTKTELSELDSWYRSLPAY